MSETDDSYLTKTSEYESYEKSLLKKKKKKYLLVKMGSQFCEKLTPAEFQQLQDFAACKWFSLAVLLALIIMLNITYLYLNVF